MSATGARSAPGYTATVIARGEAGFGRQAKISAWVFVSLAGAVAGLTMLFLGMRGVMEVGGACADGGPYVSAQPCPEGVPLAMLGGLFGGLVFFGIYVYQTLRYGIPGFASLAWSALFLSLGWNFLDF